MLTSFVSIVMLGMIYNFCGSEVPVSVYKGCEETMKICVLGEGLKSYETNEEIQGLLEDFGSCQDVVI